MKELNIKVPEGYEIDQKTSDLSKGIIKFKKKVDLSIINDEDWFYVIEPSDNIWYIKNGILNVNKNKNLKYSYSIKTNSKYVDYDAWGETKDIKSIRKCTSEEIEKIKTIFPEAFEKKYPSSWEELEEDEDYEYYIDKNSNIEIAYGFNPNNYQKNQWTKKEYAEATLALCQLVRLRDIYNDGREIDWNSNKTKYILYFNNNRLISSTVGREQTVLVFHKEEQRDLFLENFRGLIETAKPLL